MSENVPASGNSTNETPSPRRRRRWPFVILFLLLMLVLLVALAPTLLSTGPGRRMVLSMVNGQLDGAVHVNDWSLGWLKGVEVQGLRVEQGGAQVLQLTRFQTGLSIKDAVTGNFDLGTTRIEGLDFVLKRYPDGSTNFDRLVKSDPSKPKVAPKPSQAPAELPNVRGTVDVQFRGTVEEHRKDGSVQVTHIDPSRAQATIPGINSPIKHQADINIRSADGLTGAVHAGGTVQAFQNNRFAMNALAADEKVRLASAQLAWLLPLLGIDGIDVLKGQANGELTVRMTGQQELVAEGQVAVDNLAVGGAMLKGDTFRSKRLAVTVGRTTFVPNQGRLQTGAPGKDQAIVIQMDQGTIRLDADASIDSLQRLAQNQTPVDKGLITVDVDLDAGRLATEMPRLFHLAPDVKLTSGRLYKSASITLEPGKTYVNAQVDLTGVSGQAAGKAVSPEPIHAQVSATSLGGGGAIPDLRDLSLGFSSGFGAAQVAGASIDQVQASGKFDLAQLQRQFGPLLDLGKMEMAGQAAFTLSTSGDLMKEGGVAKMQSSVVVSDLRLAGVAAEAINQPRLSVLASASLVRGRELFISAVRDISVGMQAGGEANPAVAGRLVGELAFQQRAGGVTEPVLPRLDIDSFVIDLAAAPRDVPMLQTILAKQDIRNLKGRLTAKGTLAHDGAATTVKSLSARIEGLTFEQGKTRLVPQDITLDLAAALRHKDQALAIEQLTLALPQRRTLALAASGTIRDYANQRQFDGLRATLSYDVGELLALARSAMTAEQQASIKGLKASGYVPDRAFRISGKFPTTRPAGSSVDPLEMVTVVGSLLVPQADYEGMPLKDLEIPLHLANGRLRTVVADRPAGQQYPAPATLSGGRLDIGGLEIVIVGPHLRVSAMRRDYKLLDNVAMTRQFMANFLGSMHPIFTGPEEARGTINLTLNELKSFPLDESMKRPGSADEQARFTMALTDVAIRTFMLSILARELDLPIKPNPDGTVPLAVPNARVEVRNGMAHSDLGLSFGQQEIGFRKGVVRLADNSIESMTMTIPTKLVPVLAKQKMLKQVETLDVPIKGTLAKPQFDIAKAAMNLVSPQNILEGVLGGGKKEPPGTIGKPADKDKKDSGDMLQDLLKPKKDKPEEPPGTISKPKKQPEAGKTPSKAPEEPPGTVGKKKKQ